MTPPTGGPWLRSVCRSRSCTRGCVRHITKDRGPSGYNCPMSSATDRLAARGRSHTQLRELLAARETILHAAEREAILDAADALLFDEPDAAAKRAAAHDVLTALVESERWLAGPADEARAALDGCGLGEPAPR